jgi:hypothetical protein
MIDDYTVPQQLMTRIRHFLTTVKHATVVKALLLECARKHTGKVPPAPSPPPYTIAGTLMTQGPPCRE